MSGKQTGSVLTEYGLSLGSNTGNRLKHLTSARDRLAGMPCIRITDQASVYETEPVDVKPEHRSSLFLNTVLVILSSLPPAELLDVINRIEADEGRQRSEELNEPRPIDIDIIYAGRMEFQDGRITIPHPRWASRRFVVKPLSDVRPGLLVPGESRTVRELLERLPSEPDVVLYREAW